ncbi:hypothetical protein [Shewanella marisflavi]|uniref:hypothetical protein n=1 Tax=Shewanella marisflavi TaxID=260364 RepID=UPI0012FD807D|nr:hypothetical protein [Shewanella marisflavi]
MDKEYALRANVAVVDNQGAGAVRRDNAVGPRASITLSHSVRLKKCMLLHFYVESFLYRG